MSRLVTAVSASADTDGLRLSADNVPGIASCLGVFRMAAGDTDSVAVRHATEETMYVVAGRGELHTEFEVRPFAPGDALHLPARVWHWIANVGTSEIVSVFSFPTPVRPETSEIEVARLRPGGGASHG